MADTIYPTRAPYQLAAYVCTTISTAAQEHVCRTHTPTTHTCFNSSHIVSYKPHREATPCNMSFLFTYSLRVLWRRGTPMHDTTIDVTFFPARKPREQDSMRDRTRNEGRCYRRYPTNQIKKETDAWMMELAPSVVLWGQTTFMFSVQSVH